jgi:hypothetical protein
MRRSDRWPSAQFLSGYSTLHARPANLRYGIRRFSQWGSGITRFPNTLTGAMPFPDCGAGSLCRFAQMFLAVVVLATPYDL